MAAARATTARLSGAVLFWLGFIGILGPMAIDVYLPALPQMADSFGTSAAAVQLGLSATTIGMAVGNFFVGTLSDRLGRRKPLIFTGLLMVVGAGLAASAQNLPWFLVSCVLMGIAAASVQVCGRGVIADFTQGATSTRAFSMFNSIVMIGPLFGPMGGLALLAAFGWRGIFVALGAFALLGTLGVIIFVPESLAPENRHSHGLGTSIASMVKMWRNAVYRWYAIAMFMSFAVMFTYLGTCSLTLQIELAQPAWVAAVALALNGGSIILSGVLTAALSKRVSSVALVFVSIVIQVLAIGYLAVIVATNSLSVLNIFIIYFVITWGLGMSFGPITALALTHMRAAAGTALGQMGLIQFIVAAVISVLVGTINPSPAMSMLILGGIAVAIAITVALLGRRALLRDPADDSTPGTPSTMPEEFMPGETLGEV